MWQDHENMENILEGAKMSWINVFNSSIEEKMVNSSWPGVAYLRHEKQLSFP